MVIALEWRWTPGYKKHIERVVIRTGGKVSVVREWKYTAAEMMERSASPTVPMANPAFALYMSLT